MNVIKIHIPAISGGFQEDKDLARQIRSDRLIPALEKNNTVELDFSDVTYATQSFIHALIGESLKRYGEDVLGNIEFKNCSSQLQSVIELVVDYTLGGFVIEDKEEVEKN